MLGVFNYHRRPRASLFITKTNLIYQTNLIRFRRRAIVEFNCLWDLELNSSELNSTVARRIN